MGTSVLDETSTFRTVRLEGIEHHTYWIMPLYPLVQVAWYTVVGFGLTQMRILSVVCGGVALLAWFLFVRKVTGDRTLALATLAFMCVDFQFVCASSVGRMDILCVALGFAAFAVYAVLRERHHTFAVLASNTLIAAAVMAHPLSALLFVNLWLLTALLDRARIRVGLLLKAAIPYLLGFAGWAHYILASPAEFLAQFSGNAGFGSRFSLFLQPWDTIIGEITVRYLKNFGMPPHSQGFSQLKLLILAAYIAGAAGVIAWPKLHSYVRQRPIAAIAYAQILLLPVIDGLHQHLYLVYVVPMFATLWAVLYVHAWRDWKRFRPVLAVVGAVLIAVQFGVHFSRMRQNGRSNRYVPAARFVQGMAHGRSVMGSAELAFELGFSGRLIDDWRLGYRSGKRPDVLVVDEPRYAQWIALLEEREPDNYRYIQTLLKNDYSLVYDRPGYKIYDRKLAQRAEDAVVESEDPGTDDLGRSFKDDVLRLNTYRANSGMNSFVLAEANVASVLELPLTTIDKLIAELKLPRVDFIKMDIEGSEQKALAGAANTLAAYHPKLGLATYHLPDDNQRIPEIVRAAWPGYRRYCTSSYIRQDGLVLPEAVRFE